LQAYREARGVPVEEEAPTLPPYQGRCASQSDNCDVFKEASPTQRHYEERQRFLKGCWEQIEIRVRVEKWIMFESGGPMVDPYAANPYWG
jgi:hypothetical protein